ncbi:MAG: S8 family serine peptidase [Oscillospiraceae bacterium]|nr:S8 family serine peptidase [Oscillospiraceae bacterium]
MYSTDNIPVIDDTLDENAPVACVIDSGVFTGNPLLSKLIVAEEVFDLTENTTTDLNGHGTGTAGIIASGDFENFDKENRVFKPFVRIYNGTDCREVFSDLASDSKMLSDKILAQSQNLARQRDLLLPRLMSGKLEVN